MSPTPQETTAEPPASPTEEQDRIRALEAEVDSLRKYKSIFEAQTWTAKVAAKLTALLWLSPELSLAIKNWLEARRLRAESLPLDETADLAAAVVRRIVKVGTVAAVIALIPSALLVWQNVIMRFQTKVLLDQNALISQQNQSLIDQIEAQRDASRRDQISRHLEGLMSVDRTKLWLAIAYFNSDQEASKEAQGSLARHLLESDGDGNCNALEALSRIAPTNGSGVDSMLIWDVTAAIQPFTEIPDLIGLGGIEIRNLVCRRRKFHRVSFRQLSFPRANLQEAEFQYVNLDGTRFSNADLRGAHFDYGIKWNSEEAGHATVFSDSDLSFASFKTTPPWINLRGAKLIGTYLPFVGPDGNKFPALDQQYSESAICLPPNPAWECHKWHRQRFLAAEAIIAQTEVGERPLACPATVEGPIISSWPVTDCEVWLAPAYPSE